MDRKIVTFTFQVVVQNKSHRNISDVIGIAANIAQRDIAKTKHIEDIAAKVEVLDETPPSIVNL